MLLVRLYCLALSVWAKKKEAGDGKGEGLRRFHFSFSIPFPFSLTPQFFKFYGIKHGGYASR